MRWAVATHPTSVPSSYRPKELRERANEPQHLHIHSLVSRPSTYVAGERGMAVWQCLVTVNCLLHHGDSPQSILPAIVRTIMASAKLAANMETSAPCPVCSKQILLEAMNGHIDLCLITGGLQLDDDDPTGTGSTFTQKDGSTDCVTPTSSSSSKKGSSPAPSGGGRGRQSLLAFGKRLSPPGSTAGQPPAKSRKLVSTHKSTHTASQQPITRY